MNQEEILNTYGKDVIEALSPIVKWQYDDFHKALLAEFSVDKETQAKRALRHVLPRSWDAKTIKKAPIEIKHLAGSFCKLVKEQQLLSVEPEKNPRVMAVWWPWGHGATISVRIFLVNASPYEQKKGFLHKLKHMFN
ncbi:MAG: hypothetical protein ACI88A_000397 [Paraglaciecola sp.]|jgi:hypothetical protein